MKLLFTQESDFRRERDFGSKVSATFDFVSSQFKPLLKCLAYFALPGALLMGIGLGMFMGPATGFYASLFRGAQQSGANAMSSLDPLAMYRGWGGVGLLLTVLGSFTAFLLLSSTVYTYLRVRLNLPATETVQPRQVWDWMRPRLGRMVLACLLLFGLSFVVMLVFGVVFAGIAALGGVGWAILLVFLLYAALMWIAGCLSLYFPVLWLEDVGPLQALTRCFYLIKGKWWSTFGLLMVMAIIQSTMSYIFAIPMYGLLMMDILQLTSNGAPHDTSLLMQAATLLYSGSAVLLLALPLLALGFQYFNLAERRDSIGARQQLAMLGQTAAPETTSQFYRPDEEGEY
ncbi:hypothetical protein [Hymenobacter negativus]|uniref:DUF7847 domain-containing protein n=1 Tax=Hymenobacter negativus TaxID=2795026 RepID=A0ABS3QN76_9BACT|nr:hypothetical protein [Hymenobacter negativus]MBO2012739.1 hypothetical protein [Hymenobacter negativus]